MNRYTVGTLSCIVLLYDKNQYSAETCTSIWLGYPPFNSISIL